jgi:hypothetical protein
VRFRRRGAPTEGEPKTPAEAAEKAFGYALRLLGYRARSEWEVRDRLRRREYEEAVIDQVVERLCAVGLIDDAVFVEDYVRSHTAEPGVVRSGGTRARLGPAGKRAGPLRGDDPERMGANSPVADPPGVPVRNGQRTGFSLMGASLMYPFDVL